MQFQIAQSEHVQCPIRADLLAMWSSLSIAEAESVPLPDLMPECPAHNNPAPSESSPVQPQYDTVQSAQFAVLQLTTGASPSDSDQAVVPMSASVTPHVMSHYSTVSTDQPEDCAHAHLLCSSSSPLTPRMLSQPPFEACNAVADNGDGSP